MSLRLAAAVLVLFLLDGLIFRSGWYLQWLDPNSSAGQVEGYLSWLAQEPRESAAEVIVLGDSRIGHALSAPIAGAATGNAMHFWNFGIPGTLPRDWYYMLRDADLDHRRFAAVVLALDQYSDEDYQEVYADRIVDLNFLIGRLRISDCPGFAGSMLSLDNRIRGFVGCVLKGSALGADVRGFLAEGAKRVERARAWRTNGLAGVNGFEGIDRNLIGLEADWEHHRITFPEGIDEATRATIQATVMPNWPPHTGATTRYRLTWLPRIFDLYKDSPTRVILLELPRAPLPKPESATPAAFLESALPREGVLALDRNTFRDLENPEYFFDGLHLNRRGRAIFSERLGWILQDRLSH